MRKAIFITGAASGIGRATAELFARNGWFVGLYDTDRQGLETVRREVGEDACVHGVLDVTDANAFRAAVEAFGRAAGDRLDVLVNSAGVLHMVPFADLDLAHAARMVDINAKGVVYGISAALPLLRQTPGSCVLNMASASAVYGVPELAVYSATKFFVKGLTEALDLELARSGIAVRDISPSYVATPMLTRQNYKTASLRAQGTMLAAKDVAAVAWRAANAPAGAPVHWYPQPRVAFLARISGLFPSLSRAMMRRIAGM